MTEDVLMTKSPSSFDNMNRFFERTEVREAFHIAGIDDKQPRPKNVLNKRVYDAFVTSGDFCTNSSYQYAELLKSKEIDLMIYSSTVDPLLGPPTTEGGIKAIMQDLMQDPSPDEGLVMAYEAANKTLWTAGGSADVAGYAKCTALPGVSKRFCYVVVRNAGHMTPAFMPKASREMLDRFLNNYSFGADGDNMTTMPECAPCGGAGPFAGKALPDCAPQHAQQLHV